MSHSSASRPISVSIVGAAGLIGRRHVQHVLDDAGFTLTSIVDPTPGGVELAKELGVSYFADIAALLGPPPRSETTASSPPQAAIIATPSALHISQAILFVERGIHVLIEKPLCNSSEEAGKLLEVSRREGAGTILVGFHRRFNPYIIQLRKFLYGHHLSPPDTDASAVGRVVAFHGFWCTRKPMSYFEEAPWRMSKQQGGGVVMTNMSHELDLMRFLFGEIDRVYAEEGKRTRAHDVEETVSITIHFVDGTVGTFLLSESVYSILILKRTIAHTLPTVSGCRLTRSKVRRERIQSLLDTTSRSIQSSAPRALSRFPT